MGDRFYYRYKYMYRLPITVIVLVMLAGCGTIGRFDEDNEERLVQRNVYPAVQIDFTLLSGVGRGGMFADLALMLSPLVILDIPISFIVDTIMLPYDIGMYAYNSHYINYWSDVSKNRSINRPLSEYLLKYNKTGAVAMLSTSRYVEDQDVLNLFFDVAAANEAEPVTSRKIITRLVTRADINAGFSSLRTHTCNAISSDITNTKFSGGIHVIVKGAGYPDACIQSLADGGLGCTVLVLSTRLQEKYVRKCYQEYPEKLNQWISMIPSTPADIQISIFNDEFNKLAALNHPLSRITYHNDSMTVLGNLARTTKDPALIARLHELDNQSITMILTGNPSVPVEYKLATDSFISNYVSSDSTTKEELIELIREHPDNHKLLLAIASGKHVDNDVYDALMKFTPQDTRADVYERILSNRELSGYDILFELASRPDAKELLTQESFQHLLSLTETPSIATGDYGILEYVVNHPEVYRESALLEPELLPGEWVIREQTNNIKLEKGLIFGFFYKVTKESSKRPSKIRPEIIPPKGSPTRLVHELKQIDDGKSWHDIDQEYVYMYRISEDWEMMPGDWVFKLSHRGKVLSSVTFHLFNE